MKILAKFNLILIVLFGAGMYFVSRLAYSFLEQNAATPALTLRGASVKIVLARGGAAW